MIDGASSRSSSCIARELVDDAGLWYANEGAPPFPIQGLAIPRDWSDRYTDDEGRYAPEGRKFLLPSRKLGAHGDGSLRGGKRQHHRSPFVV